MITPIPRPAASKAAAWGLLFPVARKIGGVVCLLALVTAGAWAAEESPGEELGRLARALREEISSENYLRLARFAEEYRESELSAQASYALAQADLAQKRWADARVRLLAARTSPWLADYAALALARADAELGLLEVALARLDAFSFRDSLLEAEALALRVDLLLRAGRAREATEWLLRLPDGQSRPELLFALAGAQRAAGESRAAALTLQRVYYEFPLSRQAEPSNQLLAQLRAELKADYPEPGIEPRRVRAENLWARRAFRGARSAYADLARRAAEPQRTQARLRAAVALFQTGGTPAACEELARLGNVAGELEAEWRSYRARCALREGKRARAEAELAALAAKFPGTEWHQEALLAAGNTALAANEAERAREYFRQLVAVGGSGPAVADGHWKLAWLTHRAGEKAEAARLFDEHLQQFPNSHFFPRALFWRARLAAEQGEAQLAEKLLAELQECAPRDYLAQRAERWQATAKSASAGSASAGTALCRERPAPPGLSPLARRRLEKATALERLSFHEQAEAELEAALEEAAHPLVATARARLAFSQQKYARATETFNRAFPAYWRYQLSELPREAWEILFPRPYWDLIVREAERNRLDPYLVAALIRQESRFESRAQSSAGALGLMQLMPATARAVARNRSLSRSRLTEPELNIQLGTRYLASLLRRFGGSVEKAVAAYNAGGSRIEEWASRGSTGEPAEFVENIPLRQTREFVYIVLRNYRFYRDLYAAEVGGAVPAAAGHGKAKDAEAAATGLNRP